MIKVLVVDDSAFMRKIVSDIFNQTPGFIVMDTARSGLDAIEKLKRNKPDVITMDVEMPGMDGLSALKIIMEQYPTPVVMLSSLTKDGAEATLKALELGAIDFVAKAGGVIADISSVQEELVQKVRAAAHVNVRQLSKQNMQILKPIIKLNIVPFTGEQVVAIGTSTGGPRALQEIISKIPANFPAGILIVQHMPPGFTKSLSERLNSLSVIRVKEAENGDVVRPGLALIAPGDYHMRVIKGPQQQVQIKLSQEAPINGHRPAVDPMMQSVAEIFQQNTVGVILTGMGTDGSVGIKKIKERGGRTIAEDESSAVVYGMPRAAVELGVVDKVTPLLMVANEIIRCVTK